MKRNLKLFTAEQEEILLDLIQDTKFKNKVTINHVHSGIGEELGITNKEYSYYLTTNLTNKRIHQKLLIDLAMIIERHYPKLFTFKFQRISTDLPVLYVK